MANRNHDPKKTHEIALSGLLFALAMALSFIEGTLVIPGLAPGMKLGLANIVVMYALFFMGARQALYLDLLKALFVFLVSGWTAGFLSLCGGLLSLLVMWVLYYKLPFRPTWFICRSAAHCPTTSASCLARAHPVLGHVAVLCAGDAGAGPRHGRPHVADPPGHPARTGQTGL